MTFTYSNAAMGIPSNHTLVPGPNGVSRWVLNETLPETQRSFDAEAEIRALCKTVREQAEEMQAQYRMIEKLRSEMDQLHVLIKENHSRQLNGAGYWDPA